MQQIDNELYAITGDSIGFSYENFDDFELAIYQPGSKASVACVHWPIPALRTVREVRELAERMHAATIKPTIPAACPNGCNHTVEEHEAFDRGVKDGESGVDCEAPFEYTDTCSLFDAWQSGYSVGKINARK